MDVKLPQLGEDADAGKVVSILVSEGDEIAKNDPVIEIESDKALAEIPAPVGGKVGKIHASVGDQLAPGDVILTLEGSDGAVEEAPDAEPPAATAPVQSQVPVAPVAAAPVAPVAPGQPIPPSGGGEAASPTVRKYARDLGIDLGHVSGTERGGRVSLSDLKNYVQWAIQTAWAATQGGQQASPSQPAPAEQIDFSQWGPISTRPVEGIRAAISKKMSESWNSVPRVTQFDEADVSGLLALSKKHGAAYEAKGGKLTLTCFIIKALVPLLKEFPELNSSLDLVAGEMVLKDYCHLGIAVDTENGLMVPVIRDADKKSVLELSQSLIAVAEKARSRKISAEDMKGGTFTISNQGGIGGGHFTPIVNTPEVAILGVGRGKKRPVLVGGKKLEERMFMPLCLSYDHRIIDGGTAARFSMRLVEELENFDEKQLNP